jgi:hypothetical protein
MRKVLAVVMVAAILCVGALSASAQVPNITVYFDKILQHTDGYCQGMNALDTLSVTCNNFNMFMSTIEFSIAPPTADAIYLSDIHVAGSLHLGNSPTGITISYPTPKNAFLPFVCMYYQILWQCDDCSTAPQHNVPIIVQGHPYNGLITAVEWQTYRIVEGVGMTSLICPDGVKTETSTWGGVKALYSE